jgi:hypothetical protein
MNVVTEVGRVLKFRFIFAFLALDDSVSIKREATMTLVSVFLKETAYGSEGEFWDDPTKSN